MDYSELIRVENTLDELEVKDRRKIVRKLKKQLEKLLKTDTYVFKSSKDYLLISKLQEMCEKYQELL